MDFEEIEVKKEKKSTTLCDIINEKYDAAKQHRDNVVRDSWQQIDSYDKHRQWKDGVIKRYDENDEALEYDDGDDNINDTSYISEYKREAAAMFDTASIKPTLVPKTNRDVESVAKTQALLNLAIDKSGLDLASNKAIEQCKLFGVGYYVVDIDTLAEVDYGITKTRGQIKAKYYDVSNCFPDPRAKSTDDMEYFIIKENIPYEQLQRMKYLYLEETENDSGTGEDILSVLDNGSDNIEDIQTINESKRKYIYKNINEIDENCTPKDNVEDLYSDYNSVYQNLNHGVTLTRYFEKRFDKETLKFYIFYSEMANDTVIREEDLLISRMPIVAYFEEDRRSSFYPVSRAEKMLGANKLYNISESIISHQAKAQAANKYAVVDDAGTTKEEVDELIAAPYDCAIEMKGANGRRISDLIQKIELNPISKEQMEYKENMKLSLENTSGVSKFATGQNSGSITTSSGVNAMINQALSTQKHWANNQFKEGYLKAIELILEYMQIHIEQLETGSIEMVIQNENGIYSNIEVTSKDIKNARFNIKINTLQGFIPDVESSKNEVMKLYTNVMQYGIKDNQFPFKWSTLLTRYLNVPDSDRITQDAIDYENNMEEQKLMFFTQLYNTYTQAVLSQPDILKLYQNDQQVQEFVNEQIKNSVMLVIKQMIPSQPQLTNELASKILPQLLLGIRQQLGLPTQQQQTESKSQENIK